MPESLLADPPAPPANPPAAPQPTPEPASQPFNLHSLVDDKTGNFKEGINWEETLKPHGLQELAGTLSKYTGPKAFYEGIKNLNQLASGRLKGLQPPSGPDDSAALKEWQKHFGVPDTPEGYEVKLPEAKDLPEGVEISEDMLKQFLPVFHKHNIPPAAVQELIDLHVQATGHLAESAITQQVQAEKEALAAEEQKLRDEFGAGLGKTLEKASRAAALLDLDPKDSLFATADRVKAFAKLADIVGEDNLPGSLSDQKRLNKDEAMKIINDNTHPKHKQYWDGDPTVISFVNNALHSSTG